MSTKCIDISKYQGNVDFAKVKKDGISSVILQAGYGNVASQKDPKFDTYYKEAKAVGLKVGVYWYSYAVSTEEAKREAAACIACIKGKTFDGPVFYDIEDEGTMGKCSKASITSMTKAFCDAIIAAGFRAGVYANLNWFTNKVDLSALKAKKYPIWLAQYSSVRGMDCDIWQYTSTGKVKGISGSVDMNYVYTTSIFNASKPTAKKSNIKNVSYTVKVTDRAGAAVRKSHSSTSAKIATIAYNKKIVISKECDGWGYVVSKGGWVLLKKVAKVVVKKSTYSKGDAIRLKSAPLYISSTAKTKSGTATGTYYIYSVLPNHYKITTSKKYVGKTPESKYVTGFVKKSDVK